MSIAVGARDLSGCPIKRGAVIVRDRRLLAYGFNRKITVKGTWEISAIYDAVFGARTEDLDGSTLFCTYFPSVDDIILIASIGGISINFMDSITETNSEAVRLLNQLTEESIPLEIVQLQNN
jgi:tRNA(Arg) A34 adenosine deaminase TadA